LSHSEIVDPVSSIPLLELPGTMSGEAVKACVPAPAQSDPI